MNEEEKELKAIQAKLKLIPMNFPVNEDDLNEI